MHQRPTLCFSVTLVVKFNFNLFRYTHKFILRLLTALKHSKIIPKRSYIEKNVSCIIEYIIYTLPVKSVQGVLIISLCQYFVGQWRGWCATNHWNACCNGTNWEDFHILKGIYFLLGAKKHIYFKKISIRKHFLHKSADRIAMCSSISSTLILRSIILSFD